MARFSVCAALLLALALAAAGEPQLETALQASKRLFPEIGPGIRTLRRGAAGRYFILVAPGPAVLEYDAQGQRVAHAPATPSKEASLVYGADLDLDSDGRIYVADQGGNAVKVFAPDGSLAMSLPVPAPTSVVALANGDFAVASGRSPRLVTVYDARGKVVREFGDPTEIAERGELNRFLNIGRLATDLAGHIYYAFSYLPEPTIRKYDRYGYALAEIQLTGLEFQPVAQAVRREITRQERGGTPNFRPVLATFAVDPQTEEIWAALGPLLVHFDRDGNRRATYRTFTPEGARLEATAILLEPDRLLLAADPLGIYEFARPDKPQR